MKLLYLDFETFYSTEYSLRKLDPPSYILDPRFELIMAGFAFDDGPVSLVGGPAFEGILKTWNPDEIAMVSHNSQFDASILSWRYNWRPALIIDTLSISRTVISNKIHRHDLGSVCNYLGFPPKGEVVTDVKGMTAADIKANGLWDRYAQYCKNDTESCRQIYRRLSPELPDEELLVHDLVLRMAVEPVLHADVTALAEYHAEVMARKETIFARAMLLGIESKKDLMSNDKFAKVLEGFGVTPPKKTSPITGMQTYAFAKTDDDFQELREHENPYVRDLVEARLGYKSTIEETRCARLMNIGQLNFLSHPGKPMMPIALRIGGARTHRFSGDWKCNFQNMGRNSPIRKALVAPPGHQLVAADAAQIEARILAWYCGQEDLLDQFRQGEDVYAHFASRLFGKTITKETFPLERFLGKTAVLGCGYGCGAEKFATMVKSLSALTGDTVDLPIWRAQEIVDTYRTVNNRISYKWKWLDTQAVPQIAWGRQQAFDDGPVTFAHEEVTGPSNLKMFYPKMMRSDGDWLYQDGDSLNKMYGAKLAENLVQHMARVFIMQVALRMIKFCNKLGARLVLQCHDELVYCVPDEYVELLKRLLHTEMTAEPKWAPGLPLATDVKSGPNYGACK